MVHDEPRIAAGVDASAIQRSYPDHSILVILVILVQFLHANR